MPCVRAERISSPKVMLTSKDVESFSTALIAACHADSEEIVEMLLDKGADVNAQSGNQGSALRLASLLGYEKVVEMLLGKGADVNAQSKRFGSALQEASRNGHEVVVEILLDKGADVNSRGGKN